jgi:hypothetical protein
LTAWDSPSGKVERPRRLGRSLYEGFERKEIVLDPGNIILNKTGKQVT